MKYEELNGKVYLVTECTKCKNVLKFHLEENQREVFASCASCGHSVSAMIPSLKEYKKNK